MTTGTEKANKLIQCESGLRRRATNVSNLDNAYTSLVIWNAAYSVLSAAGFEMPPSQERNSIRTMIRQLLIARDGSEDAAMSVMVEAERAASIECPEIMALADAIQQQQHDLQDALEDGDC